MSEENTTPDAENSQVQEEPTQPTEKTFSQTEVNALLADEKRKLKAKYADYDELKTTVSNLETIKTDAYEQGKAEATSELVVRLVDTEIRSTATALGFNDVSDALTFFGDKSSISYDPETGVDQEAINSRLTELAEQKSYLLKSEKTGGTTITSRPKPKTTTSVEETKNVVPSAAAGLRQAFSKKN